MTSRAPSLGRGCRAQRGGVGFLFAAKPPPFCLPPWGRGTASAVDRVLSLTVHLRRSSSPLFHTASTLSGSLRSPPSPRGEGFVSRIPLSPSNLRPFGAPPSIGRRECPREPLPLEGAAERSEAGLASFFAAKPPPLCLPHWGRGTAPAVDRVLSQTAYLRRSLPALFHTAFPIQPPPLRGTSFHRKEGVSTRAPSLGRGCRAQRGGVGFLFCGEAPSSLPSPSGKGDRVSGG